MRTLVLGRTPARLREVLQTEEFGVLIVGGGVEPDARAAIKEFAAKRGVRRVIDGALTPPFDAYARREYEPQIRQAASDA
ncbi:hypothetical protein [Streptomyces flaveolus]|uniref:hypothetical protein n=1 Tax=Streptomyces flaveolus TaxID=67297 RepID=UPI0033C2CA6B